MTVDAGDPLFIAWAIVTAVVFAGQLIEIASVLIFGPGRTRGGFFPFTYRVFVFGWIAAFCVFAATIAYAPLLFDA